MKRFIRNKVTRAYLSSGGQWIPDFRFAQEFRDLRSALSAVGGAAVKELELVLVVGQSPSDDYDVALPVSQFGKRSWLARCSPGTT